MLRIQREVEEFFKIFSKYTPENPDVHAAHRIAMRPIVRFWLSFADTDSVLPDVWTIATPIVSNTTENHLTLEKRR